MKYYIIAHDLGTSGDKATLFTTDGEVVTSYTAPYDVHFFNGNYAEQNPEDWWKAFCIATKEVLAEEDPRRVKAVSFSAQMQCCLPVDENGTALRPAIIWADQRATEETDLLIERVGFERIYEITGHRASAGYSVEKMMWVKKHEPEIYAKTYKWLQPKDYIIRKLTGKFLTDNTDASGTNGYDLRRKCWSEEIISAAELDMEKFPEIYDSIDIAGSVKPEAAQESGLAVGTPIVMGGGDGPCSAVGAACIEDGELYLTYGTSSWIGGTTKEPFIDENQRLMCFAHVIPDRFMPCGVMNGAGSSYAYIRKALCDKMPYDEMNKMIEASPVGAKNLIFIPYLLGERCPRWNPKTSGAFLGIKDEHEKKEYVRAVIEGIAMNLDLILQCYRAKQPVTSMCLTGGGAKGDVVAQILADVMQCELKRPREVEIATSIGAAVIAGVGVGIFEDFSEVRRFMKFEDVVVPNPENAKAYEDLKPIFDEAYTCLLPLYEKFSALASK